jgi:acetyl-CoA carboxylase biotin carboxylase subunit
VTELVTGLDLVKEQIRVAAGYRLAFDQHEVRQRGAAIECRISAEDPAQDFFPSPGEITALVMPAGPGVRNDSGVYQGWRVPLEYDPLMAKLIVWGSDRQEAISRTRRALGEYEVGGVKTTIPFFLRVLRDPEYLAGRLDTGLVGRILAQGDEAARISEREDLVEVPGGAPEERSRDSGLVAMLAASLEANTAHSSNSPACGRVAKESRWKAAGRDALLRASTPGGR